MDGIQFRIGEISISRRDVHLYPRLDLNERFLIKSQVRNPSATRADSFRRFIVWFWFHDRSFLS